MRLGLDFLVRRPSGTSSLDDCLVVIDDLICKATRAHAFADSGNQYFSLYSQADIFEVTPAGGIVRSNIRNDELRSSLKVRVKFVKTGG